MTPEELITHARELGAFLSLTEAGAIAIDGTRYAREQLIDIVRAHKPALVEYFKKLADVEKSCCRCGLPAEYHSPGGCGYCSDHYWCIRGHRPEWRRWQGVWVCECVVIASQAKRREKMN